MYTSIGRQLTNDRCKQHGVKTSLIPETLLHWPETLLHSKKTLTSLKDSLTLTTCSSRPQSTSIWLSLTKKSRYYLLALSCRVMHHLECWECFKYLDLLLLSDISWTAHVEPICSMAKNCWDYCTEISINTLTQRQCPSSIYVSLVCPHQESSISI